MLSVGLHPSRGDPADRTEGLSLSTRAGPSVDAALEHSDGLAQAGASLDADRGGRPINSTAHGGAADRPDQEHADEQRDGHMRAPMTPATAGADAWTAVDNKGRSGNCRDSSDDCEAGADAPSNGERPSVSNSGRDTGAVGTPRREQKDEDGDDHMAAPSTPDAAEDDSWTIVHVAGKCSPHVTSKFNLGVNRALPAEAWAVKTRVTLWQNGNQINPAVVIEGLKQDLRRSLYFYSTDLAHLAEGLVRCHWQHRLDAAGDMREVQIHMEAPEAASEGGHSDADEDERSHDTDMEDSDGEEEERSFDHAAGRRLKRARNQGRGGVFNNGSGSSSAQGSDADGGGSEDDPDSDDEEHQKEHQGGRGQVTSLRGQADVAPASAAAVTEWSVPMIMVDMFKQYTLHNKSACIYLGAWSAVAHLVGKNAKVTLFVDGVRLEGTHEAKLQRLTTSQRAVQVHSVDVDKLANGKWRCSWQARCSADGIVDVHLHLQTTQPTSQSGVQLLEMNQAGSDGGSWQELSPSCQPRLFLICQGAASEPSWCLVIAEGGITVQADQNLEHCSDVIAADILRFKAGGNDYGLRFPTLEACRMFAAELDDREQKNRDMDTAKRQGGRARATDADAAFAGRQGEADGEGDGVQQPAFKLRRVENKSSACGSSQLSLGMDEGDGGGADGAGDDEAGTRAASAPVSAAAASFGTDGGGPAAGGDGGGGGAAEASEEQEEEEAGGMMDRLIAGITRGGAEVDVAEAMAAATEHAAVRAAARASTHLGAATTADSDASACAVAAAKAASSAAARAASVATSPCLLAAAAAAASLDGSGQAEDAEVVSFVKEAAARAAVIVAAAEEEARARATDAETSKTAAQAATLHWAAAVTAAAAAATYSQHAASVAAAVKAAARQMREAIGPMQGPAIVRVGGAGNSDAGDRSTASCSADAGEDRSGCSRGDVAEPSGDGEESRHCSSLAKIAEAVAHAAAGWGVMAKIAARLGSIVQKAAAGVRTLSEAAAATSVAAAACAASANKKAQATAARAAAFAVALQASVDSGGGGGGGGVGDEPADAEDVVLREDAEQLNGRFASKATAAESEAGEARVKAAAASVAANTARNDAEAAADEAARAGANAAHVQAAADAVQAAAVVASAAAEEAEEEAAAEHAN